MARIIRQGSPGALYRLTAADLPADNDARQSFLRYVDLSGFNLSALDLRDSDILDSDCRNVVLGAGQTAWMVSRRNNWTGAVLPSDLRHNRELISEWLRQRRSQVSGTVRSRIDTLRTYMDASYDRSFYDAIQFMMTNYGWTAEQVRTNFSAALTGLPSLVSELQNYVREGSYGAIRTRQKPLTAYPVAGGSTLDLSAFAFGLDRYDAARRLETQYPDWYWYCGWLDPYPIIITARSDRIVGPPRWNWWEGAWIG